MNTPANADDLGLCLCHGCGQACELGSDKHTCDRCGAAIHRRKANAISRGWAFLLAALVFYIPANLLPVMHTEMLGSGSESTIGGGVLEFWEAGAWDIALIIFIASVGVPAIKFFSLGLLLLTAQRGSTWSLPAALAAVPFRRAYRLLVDARCDGGGAGGGAGATARLGTIEPRVGILFFRHGGGTDHVFCDELRSTPDLG